MMRFVRHPKKPEWGIGAVLNEGGGKLRILFHDGTERKLASDRVPLDDVDPPKDHPALKTGPGGKAGADLTELDAIDLWDALANRAQDRLASILMSAPELDDDQVEGAKEAVDGLIADYAFYLNVTVDDEPPQPRASAAQVLLKQHGDDVVRAAMDAAREASIDNYEGMTVSSASPDEANILLDRLLDESIDDDSSDALEVIESLATIEVVW